jgi:hypothetical protein
MTTMPFSHPSHLDDDAVQLAAESALRDTSALAHLQRCAACTARVQAVHRLLAAAASLPRERLPERDLWDDIRRTLEGRGAIRARVAPSAAPGEAPRRGWRVPSTAAAALLLIASLGLWLGSESGSRLSALGSRPSALAEGRGPRAESYAFTRSAAAAEELAADLARRDVELPPATRASVAASLRTLDRAIAEGDSALRAAPRDRTVVALLAAAHEQRLDLLRRTVALAEGL